MKPECLDCNQTQFFNIPLRGWEHREYDADGHLKRVLDTDVEMYTGEQISCSECDSTNVWGDF